jgi:FAD:protein FMN transferase
MQAQTRRSFLNFIDRRQPAPNPYWLHVNRTAMACRFEVTLPMSERSGVAVAVDALDEIDRLEEQLSIFQTSSEVSRINRLAANAPVEVEESLLELLKLGTDLNTETGGAFDITSGPLTRCWGFLRREGKFPSTEDLKAVQKLVGTDKLLLDASKRTIQFAQPGVEINLGSIGKGYALDRVASQIRGKLSNALLNAGASSMRALGAAEQSGWPVGVRDPRNRKGRLGMMRLRECALSTSGSEEQFFEHKGRRYGHIIDPRSGFPSEAVLSVSVVANSAAVSDALATAFFVGGRELAERYCATHEDVLVVMLERNSVDPIIIGHHHGCSFRMS